MQARGIDEASGATPKGTAVGPLFASLCYAHGLSFPLAEFQFAPPRKWRFDYCWYNDMIALEVEGGAWTKGRHTRGKGFLADIEKYNEAALMGYLVLRCTPQDLETGAAFALVKRALDSLKIERTLASIRC